MSDKTEELVDSLKKEIGAIDVSAFKKENFMAEPDFTDAEKIAIRKLIADGGIWGRIQTVLEENPKVMIFVGSLVAALIAWVTHGAIVVPVTPPPQIVPVIMDKKGDVKPDTSMTDEQTKAMKDSMKALQDSLKK